MRREGTHVPSEVLYHFSEDPSIEVFHPHVAPTAASEQPRVWAMDAVHAPLYWFPRDCPRVTFWAGPETPAAAVERYLGGVRDARVHAIETARLERVRACRLFVYRLDPAPFAPLAEADGHWVAHEPVRPLGVEPVGDLIERHARAGIELRVTPSLWPLADAIPATGLRFSLVRMRNARPR